jgi:hypothetical protein
MDTLFVILYHSNRSPLLVRAAIMNQSFLSVTSDAGMIRCGVNSEQRRVEGGASMQDIAPTAILTSF